MTVTPILIVGMGGGSGDPVIPGTVTCRGEKVEFGDFRKIGSIKIHLEIVN